MKSQAIKNKIKEFKEKKWNRVMDGLGDFPVSSRLFWKEINKTKSAKQCSSIPNLRVGQTDYKSRKF